MATHGPVNPRQSDSVSQGVSIAALEQAFRKQGPLSPQAASLVHEVGALGLLSGKYCRPTPSPAEALSLRNEVSAVFTASHLVTVPMVVSSIELELSSMMYMSRGMGCAVETWAAHASSGGPPPFAPVPLAAAPLAAAPFIPVMRPLEPPLPLPLPGPLPALDELTPSNALGCELEPHAAQAHAATRTEVIPTATRTLRGMLQIEHQ